MAYQRGDKFSFTTVVDIEILGYFPKGESRDGKARYSATLNGNKMLIEEDFLDSLKNAEVKQEEKQEFVDADAKVQRKPVVVRIKEEENKPKKKEVKKNGRKRNA